MPPVPRPLIAAFCGLWWLFFAAGTYLEKISSGQQEWWLDIWKGGLGGNGFSAFGAFVLAAILTSEVIFMVLTWIGNKRRVQDAAKRAAREAAEKAAVETQKAAEKAAIEAENRVRHEWEEWYEQVRADLAAGRDPSVPPPSEVDGAKG